MKTRTTFIYLNMFAAFAYCIFFALRLGISVKTGFEWSAPSIAKATVMALSAIVILLMNILMSRKPRKFFNYLQLVLTIPLFMPSRCVIKYGAMANPVFIVALALVFFTALIFYTNIVLVFQKHIES